MHCNVLWANVMFAKKKYNENEENEYNSIVWIKYLVTSTAFL